MREDDKSFHALVVSWALMKYILHEAYDALGHNSTAITYWCLQWLYNWKCLQKDFDAHMKQCLKYRQQNLHPNIMHKYT